jgi:hypothetical protein
MTGAVGCLLLAQAAIKSAAMIAMKKRIGRLWYKSGIINGDMNVW